MTPRLVVFTDTMICDGPGAHSIILWTDGIDAYAHVHPTLDACPLISRDTTQVEVTCGYLRDDETGETCGHHARFDLSDECWTANPDALRVLADNGTVIEQ